MSGIFSQWSENRQWHCLFGAWSPDGEKILSASLDHALRCWDATSLLPVGPLFQGHKELILVAAFLRDSSHAISLSRDGQLLIWDTGSGRITREVTVSKSAQSIFVAALSMDGTLLVTSDTRECIAWEIPTCNQISQIALPHIPLLQAAVIANSGQVGLTFGDGSFWIWDTTTRTHDHACFEGLGEDAVPIAMAVSPDRRLMALEIDGDNDHRTHFYDIKGQEFAKSDIRCTHPFAFSPDGKFFAASGVPSDSKGGTYKLVIRPVEEILGCGALDLPATTIPGDKGKQRSLALDPGFFDPLPRRSAGAKGRVFVTKRPGPGASSSSVREAHQQASPTTTGWKRRVLPLRKIWKPIRHPRSIVREAHQQAPRNTSQERRILPLRKIWKRVRHPRSRKSTSAVDVSPAQALNRLVASRPRQKASTRKDSTQSSSDARRNSQKPVASSSRQKASTQGHSSQSSSQARRRGHNQDVNNGEDGESDESGIVYTIRDTESVKAHGCWNIFWNWLCYKAF